MAGTDRCKLHSGKSLARARAEGQVRLELQRWGLGDATVDPGEVLLRLVSQSSARVELYSSLLERAYDAAERLRSGHEAGRLLQVDDAEKGEKPATQAAREDLDRIFTTGGVAALIGLKYSATKDGDVYATEEGIRGLAQLEAGERDRCAGFAAKAVAAGLAERQVRLAEAQGAVIGQGLRWLLDRMATSFGFTGNQLEQANGLVAEMLQHLSAGTMPKTIEGSTA